MFPPPPPTCCNVWQYSFCQLGRSWVGKTLTCLGPPWMWMTMMMRMTTGRVSGWGVAGWTELWTEYLWASTRASGRFSEGYVAPVASLLLGLMAEGHCRNSSRECLPLNVLYISHYYVCGTTLPVNVLCIHHIMCVGVPCVLMCCVSVVCVGLPCVLMCCVSIILCVWDYLVC